MVSVRARLESDGANASSKCSAAFRHVPEVANQTISLHRESQMGGRRISAPSRGIELAPR